MVGELQDAELQPWRGPVGQRMKDLGSHQVPWIPVCLDLSYLFSEGKYSYVLWFFSDTCSHIQTGKVQVAHCNGQ